MPHPAVRVRSPRLLADDRAPRQDQPRDACALAGVHDFGPEERIRARPYSASFHRVPPDTRPGLRISAYTQAEDMRHGRSEYWFLFFRTSRGCEYLPRAAWPVSGHDSDWSRSMSAIPIAGFITLRNSAGASRMITSSVGNTRPCRR